MSRTTSIRIPTRNGIEMQTGTIVLLPLVEGEAPVRWLVERHEDGGWGNLTHYASGQTFYPMLRQRLSLHRLRTGKRLTMRGAVREAIDEVVERIGIDKVRRVLALAEVLNPLPYRKRYGDGLMNAPSYD